MENEIEDILVIIAGVKENDSRAFEKLSEKYRSLTEGTVKRFAPSFGITPADFHNDNSPLYYDFNYHDRLGDSVYGIDDLRQYASVALYKAAVTYEPDEKGKKVSFGLYAKICMNNAMITELRRYRRRLKKLQSASKVGTYRRYRRTGAGSDDRFDPLVSVISDAELSDKLEKFRSELSLYEKDVFEQYIIGKSVREIAAELGKSEKSVSNALYRMKVKIKGLLKNQ